MGSIRFRSVDGVGRGRLPLLLLFPRLIDSLLIVPCSVELMIGTD